MPTLTITDGLMFRVETRPPLNPKVARTFLSGSRQNLIFAANNCVRREHNLLGADRAKRVGSGLIVSALYLTYINQRLISIVFEAAETSVRKTAFKIIIPVLVSRGVTQIIIWVLPGLFTHRGNAHSVTFGEQIFFWL
jgi:hypothetical protein